MRLTQIIPSGDVKTLNLLHMNYAKKEAKHQLTAANHLLAISSNDAFVYRPKCCNDKVVHNNGIDIKCHFILWQNAIYSLAIINEYLHALCFLTLRQAQGVHFVVTKSTTILVINKNVVVFFRQKWQT